MNYVRCDGRWAFQSGSIENTFTHSPSDTPLRSRLDFVVTQRQDGPIKPFKGNEETNYRELPMQSFDKTGADFWAGHNYLLPTYPLPPLITSHLH